MNTEELNRLIEKFYSGQTTEDEENKLSELLKRDDLPAGYDSEKAIFGYFEREGEMAEPSFGFESRILSAIDDSESKESDQRLRKNILAYLSTAAAILLLVGSFFLFYHGSKSEDTFTDPEIAYNETMKVLLDVSARMNRGTRALEPVRKMDEITAQSFNTINKSAGKIGKNLIHLDNILKTLDKNSKQGHENIK